MEIANLYNKIREAGVVGAGGAGFPSHIKHKGSVDILIANGAECEPLISKDKAIMKHFAAEISDGLHIASRWLGAKETVIGIKSKNTDEINSLKNALPRSIKIHLMKDIYPAGDEFVLVYEVTGKLIPPGGIPLEIGCVVLNVETLYNITHSAYDIPVTDKFVTVAGAVRNSSTFKIPIGTSFHDCIELAGGTSISDFAILIGGAMMGELTVDSSTPVTKTTAGLIVLPKEHPLIKKRLLPQKAVKRIGASGCDQCYRCTELCPRWLLGYEIVPHEVMRSLLFNGDRWDQTSRLSLLCIECNICSLYACPEELDPKNICTWAKRELQARGIKPDKTRNVTINPMRSSRQVSTKLLTRKLGLSPYENPASYRDVNFEPEIVRIPLKQHAGSAAIPVVKEGDKVKRGDLIGDISEELLGAKVHASINGIVESVSEFITIRRS
jgi:Na+-translocating ferredoxin:NAD+ oxidoreductase RnfC subunit